MPRRALPVRRSTARLGVVLGVLAGLFGLAACGTGGATSGPSSASRSPGPTIPAPSMSPSSTPTDPADGTPGTSASAPTSDASPTTPAQIQFATMSLEQRVGQLFMVGCPSTAIDAATKAAVTKYHVGSVILNGNSSAGVVRTQTVTGDLQALITRGPQLFVATDQEGGQVQRLSGPGFSTIPPATQQGQVAPKQLQVDTTVWAGQLHAAGVNVDLAPVLDTVPAGAGSNPPIGDLQREYGHDPATVSAHGVAVLKGLAAAGVEATVKHFPGLGRVTQNTDTASGVTDSVTTRHDAYLQPFADAIQAGTPFVMVSTAIYAKIDPHHPAAFSKKIVTGMLRDQLGFAGVIVSDDLGGAAQVAGYGVGARAVRFIAAGGDMVLTVDASQIPAMVHAVLARAERDPAFAAQVDAAALTVLQAKQKAKLLPR